MLVYKVVFNDENTHYAESLDDLLDILRFHREDEEWDLGDTSTILVDDVSQEEFDNLIEAIE